MPSVPSRGSGLSRKPAFKVGWPRDKRAELSATCRRKTSSDHVPPQPLATPPYHGVCTRWLVGVRAWTLPAAWVKTPNQRKWWGWRRLWCTQRSSSSTARSWWNRSTRRYPKNASLSWYGNAFTLETNSSERQRRRRKQTRSTKAQVRQMIWLLLAVFLLETVMCMCGSKKCSANQTLWTGGKEHPPWNAQSLTHPRHIFFLSWSNISF